jgi:hypothetical protein
MSIHNNRWFLTPGTYDGNETVKPQTSTNPLQHRVDELHQHTQQRNQESVMEES